jgi:membrane fusion protein, copper/silver efflux system
MTKARLLALSALLVLAIGLGYGLGRYLSNDDGMALAKGERGSEQGERKVAYWQAPMDASFRSDTPGKSPMGMELIPVYEDEVNGGGSEPSVRINPAVVNNLGVRTEKVTMMPVEGGVRTVGTIQINEESQSDIHTRTEGWVERLVVRAEGDHVERGDLLFEFYAPELVAAQSEYLQAAKLGRDRFTEAATERLLSLGMSSGQITQLRKRGKTLRLIKMYAPQAGVVTALDVREGMFLKPSMRAMRIVDLADVWLIADVFENDAASLDIGQKAYMTLPAFAGEIFEGEIDFIYPTTDEMARTVPVRLRFDNPKGRLKPNMYASVTIRNGEAGERLTIPQSALIRFSAGDRVIVALGEGRFRPAAVKTGTEFGDRVEVLAGLDVGERIVTSGQFLIDSEASMAGSMLRLTSPEESASEKMPGMDMPAKEVVKEPAKNEMPKKEAIKPVSQQHAGHGQPKPKTYTAMGKVISIDKDAGSITLDHEAVKELNWPGMKMGFTLTEMKLAEGLASGDSVHFTFAKGDDGYVISSIMTMGGGAE